MCASYYCSVVDVFPLIMILNLLYYYIGCDVYSYVFKA